MLIAISISIAFLFCDIHFYNLQSNFSTCLSCFYIFGITLKFGDSEVCAFYSDSRSSFFRSSSPSTGNGVHEESVWEFRFHNKDFRIDHSDCRPDERVIKMAHFSGPANSDCSFFFLRTILGFSEPTILWFLLEDFRISRRCCIFMETRLYIHYIIEFNFEAHNERSNNHLVNATRK